MQHIMCAGKRGPHNTHHGRWFMWQLRDGHANPNYGVASWNHARGFDTMEECRETIKKEWPTALLVSQSDFQREVAIRQETVASGFTADSCKDIYMSL